MIIGGNLLKEVVMTKGQLRKKIAYLEFVHDQLSTEMAHVDRLLKEVGFPNGLKSARLVALELLKDKDNLV